MSNLKTSKYIRTVYYYSGKLTTNTIQLLLRPDSLLRLWRYINHLLTYLLTYNPYTNLGKSVILINDDLNLTIKLF